MIRIAICDDEKHMADHIKEMVSDFFHKKNREISIRTFLSGEDLLSHDGQIDILFLDIQMKGMDGMETARLFREKSCENMLVFLSASRKYVFDAYDVEAFWYLLKPLDMGKLKTVLIRAVEKTKKTSGDFIMVSKERQKIKLFLDDISYFEIMGRKIVVHGPEGNFTYYGRMGVLEESLLEKGFFRCHKSYLVNLKYVDGYNRQEIFLDTGEKIGIAKRRYELFCQEYLRFMRKNGGIL